ncbi:MAG TPA: hypothetical protein VHT91_31580 [Kofleriaceae bacterium]|jgi:hypothetical protein|nr:hypothetical protein [Kofleriaceae bacterium]
MPSTPLAVSLARCAAPLGARAVTAARLVAPARFARSISGKPRA